MDHAKLLDVLTSLPVRHVILPRAVCFATSRPASHAICSFIDSRGYASGKIRRCLFIDYIINIYIKQGIHYKRRRDIEVHGVECIWIEVANNHKHILFGLFYRPPSSDEHYYTNMEDSFGLAVDTGITEIIVHGDFNFNMVSPTGRRKIDSLRQTYSLHQLITEFTNFTEHSSSLLDLILVSNKDQAIHRGVDDTFQPQQLRLYCPICEILIFLKPKVVLLLWIIYVFFCLLFGMSLCSSVYLYRVVTYWERAGLLALLCCVSL